MYSIVLINTIGEILSELGGYVSEKDVLTKSVQILRGLGIQPLYARNLFVNEIEQLGLPMDTNAVLIHNPKFPIFILVPNLSFTDESGRLDDKELGPF